MGIRACAFQRFLPAHYSVSIVYRSQVRSRAIPLFLRALRSAKAEVAYVLDSGYAGVVAAVMGRLFSGIPFVLDVGDVAYPLARATGRAWPTAGLISGVEQIGLRLASAVIVRGIVHQEMLRSQGFRHVHWIPDGVDLSSSRPRDVAALRRQLGLDDALVLGVMGSTVWSHSGRWCYGLELIEVLRLLRGEPVKGILIGDGSGLPRLRTLAHKYGLDGRIIFTGWLEYGRLPDYINLFDVAISTQTNDAVGTARTTGKLPEYLACGRYILATDVGTARRVLPPSMLVPYQGRFDPAYPQRLSERVRDVLRTPAVLSAGIDGIQIARRHFDYVQLAPRLGAVLSAVVSGGQDAAGS